MWKIILCLSVICLTTLTNGNYASHEFTEDVMFCETCQRTTTGCEIYGITVVRNDQILKVTNKWQDMVALCRAVL